MMEVRMMGLLGVLWNFGLVCKVQMGLIRLGLGWMDRLGLRRRIRFR